jgi:hypothetical protein
VLAPFFAPVRATFCPDFDARIVTLDAALDASAAVANAFANLFGARQLRGECNGSKCRRYRYDHRCAHEKLPVACSSADAADHQQSGAARRCRLVLVNAIAAVSFRYLQQEQ